MASRTRKVMFLVLTLPLLLYGVPYAYASAVSSSYIVRTTYTTLPNSYFVFYDAVCNTGDYATGGGAYPEVYPPIDAQHTPQTLIVLEGDFPSQGPAHNNTTGLQPDRWTVAVTDASELESHVTVYAVCQTPITVGGISVPEFGASYAVIALAAMAFFSLSLLRSRKSAS